MKHADPAHMSAAERLAEVGELLAAGAQRVLAQGCKRADSSGKGQEQLDVLGDVEAPCGRSAEARE